MPIHANAAATGLLLDRLDADVLAWIASAAPRTGITAAKPGNVVLSVYTIAAMRIREMPTVNWMRHEIFERIRRTGTSTRITPIANSQALVIGEKNANRWPWNTQISAPPVK